MGEIKILLGFEVGTGNEVHMSLHHTVITGMTQLSGKTTTLEAIINRVGLSAIAFKTKRGESGFKNYHEIKPFFDEKADWQYVSGLLEAVLKEKMRFERPWIMKATKDTTSLKEVLINVQTLKAEATSGLPENIYTALEEYLKIVVPQIEKFDFSRELELGDNINVIDLTEMTVELQSLVIRSTMEYVINQLHDCIVIIPEAWEHLPQGRNTPVKLYAETFIRKGAAIGNFLFIDSQDIAGIDKMPLRQCNNWILGRQREGHEVERVREQIGKARVDAEEIRTLPLGHFIAVLGDDVKKVYVLPAGVPASIGRKVALGELNVSEVGKYMKNGESQDQQPAKLGIRRFLPNISGDKAMKKVEELELKLANRDNELLIMKAEIDELRNEQIQTTVKVEQLLKQLGSTEGKAIRAQPISNENGLNLDQLNMLVDHRMHQIIKFDKPSTMITLDLSGKLRDIIKDRFIQLHAVRIRSTPPRAAHMAMVVREHKAMRRGDLWIFLRGVGRITDDFYEDIQLLEDVKLVNFNKDSGVIQWALGEHLKRELGNLYDEATINQAETYLSSLLLPSN